MRHKIPFVGDFLYCVTRMGHTHARAPQQRREGTSRRRLGCESDILIQPARDGVGQYARELWQYSSLVYLLLWRNIKLRYQHTLIGATWAILQPLLTMVIFSVLFGRLVKVPTGGLPYPVFALSALVPWTYFVHALTLSTRCLLDHHDLLTKVYFPRLILPLVAVLEAALDFLIAFTLLFLMLLLYGVTPSWHFLLLPLLVLLLMATSLGVGLWLAALNLKYRDIMSALPFMTQVLLFVTPVAYSSDLIPVAWRTVYALNPLAGVIEGFRWALLGSAALSGFSLTVSVLAGTFLLVSGCIFFRRQEDYFADEV
jgi:lipopolysaccharide transport system permease protein